MLWWWWRLVSTWIDPCNFACCISSAPRACSNPPPPIPPYTHTRACTHTASAIPTSTHTPHEPTTTPSGPLLQLQEKNISFANKLSKLEVKFYKRLKPGDKDKRKKKGGSQDTEGSSN